MTVMCKERNNKKILLVDDDAISLKVLKTIVKELGFDFECADRGEQALNMLETNQNNYYLVILDLGLPDIDGIKLLKMIREKYYNEQELQIVIVSNYANEMKEKAIKAGANIYFTKPVKKAQLESVLNKYINVFKNTNMF